MGGGGGGGGGLEHPPVQAAHVSNVMVYSHDPGKLTAVQDFGRSGPLDPADGQM